MQYRLIRMHMVCKEKHVSFKIKAESTLNHYETNVTSPINIPRNAIVDN